MGQYPSPTLSKNVPLRRCMDVQYCMSIQVESQRLRGQAVERGGGGAQREKESRGMGLVTNPLN